MKIKHLVMVLAILGFAGESVRAMEVVFTPEVDELNLMQENEMPFLMNRPPLEEQQGVKEQIFEPNEDEFLLKEQQELYFLSLRPKIGELTFRDAYIVLGWWKVLSKRMCNDNVITGCEHQVEPFLKIPAKVVNHIARKAVDYLPSYRYLQEKGT